MSPVRDGRDPWSPRCSSQTFHPVSTTVQDASGLGWRGAVEHRARKLSQTMSGDGTIQLRCNYDPVMWCDVPTRQLRRHKQGFAGGRLGRTPTLWWTLQIQPIAAKIGSLRGLERADPESPVQFSGLLHVNSQPALNQPLYKLSWSHGGPSPS